MPDFPSSPRVAHRLEGASHDLSFLSAPAIATGTKFADPINLPGNNAQALAVHPWANYVAAGQTATSPYFYAWQWDDRAAGGWGSRITPSSAGAQVYALAWHPNGRFLAVGYASSPFLKVYPFNPQSGSFSAALGNPATLPGTACRGLAWSVDGAYLFAANASSPYLHGWAFDASGSGAWGAKVADAPSGAGFDGRAVAVHPSGAFLALGSNSSPTVSVIGWTGSGFASAWFGSGHMEGLPLGWSPPGSVNALAWSPDGRFLAAAGGTSPYVKVWPFDATYRRSTGLGRFGAAFANPATLPAGAAYGVAFARNGAGTALAVAHDTTPFLSVYPWSPAGFGTKLADPVTLPTGNGRAVAFSPFDQALLVAHSTSPFVSAYPFTAPVRHLYPVSGFPLEAGAAQYQGWVSRLVQDGLDLQGVVLDVTTNEADLWFPIDGLEWDRMKVDNNAGGTNFVTPFRLDLPLRFREALVPLAGFTRVYRGQVVGAAAGTPFFYGLYTGGQNDRAIGVALEDADNGSGSDGDQVVRVGIAALAITAGAVRATFIGG